MPEVFGDILARRDGRIILHFDYDCFYASVVESENPSLRTKPLAIQQKQIIVTCNYEARRRGLSKLQLVSEAKKLCPEVIIVLGEDLTRFRDASKDLYSFLRSFSWNDRAERLGFDEVWLDVSDIIEYNTGVLNFNAPFNSFFYLSQSDPTRGFPFNASVYAGPVYPDSQDASVPLATGVGDDQLLETRLLLASHLAAYLRAQLHEHKGYTATVGISSSKLLSKLVGNTHKPKSQTTLLPPYEIPRDPLAITNIQAFMGPHEIGAVPGIGFKLAQKLREHVLQRPVAFNNGLVYGGAKEHILVEDVCRIPDLSPSMLERLLAGPGSQRGIGTKVFQLLHGVDHSEVAHARNVPRQISIEDSYIRLDTMAQLLLELNALSTRLIERMRLDLTETTGHGRHDGNAAIEQSWIGRPTTVRLTTRPRQPLQPDGTRVRSFKRFSRSMPMPIHVFNLHVEADKLAAKLVNEALIPLFKRLHPEKSGWNLSLVNVAATDIADVAGESNVAVGRDIQAMFKTQDQTLRQFKVLDPEQTKAIEDLQVARADESRPEEKEAQLTGSCKSTPLWLSDSDQTEEEEQEIGLFCPHCRSSVPRFAQAAHQRYHDKHDGHEPG